MTGAPDAAVDWESEYQALLEFVYLTPVGIIKFDPDGRVKMSNPAAVQYLMPLAADGNMANLYELFAPMMPCLRCHVDHFEGEAGRILDQVRFAVAGTPLVLTLSINKIDATTLMAVIQDVTRTVEQECRIRADHLRLCAIFDNVRDYAIFTADAQGYIDEWNCSLRHLGGWEPTDTSGSPIDIFFPPGREGHATAMTLLERARLNGRDEYEGMGIRKNGDMFWSNTVATALSDSHGNADGYFVITRDIGDRKAKEDALLALATTDPLTGASNRRAGTDSMEEAFRRWRRYGRTFSLLMIDCDHFKAVNDQWGHEVGDSVLVELVRRCRENLRETDIVIRWGGEEFLVVLPEIAGEAATQVAERLRLVIEGTEIICTTNVTKITISIGVTESIDEDSTTNDVVHRADRALYHAKRNGRNQISFG